MFRRATSDDLGPLRDLEREASLVGLAHVFPADRYPYPDDDVLARWALVMQDPTACVLVRDDVARPGQLDVLAAYDDRSLRHLAVHPDRWGTGLASTAVDTVLAALAERGTTVAELWCLHDNGRARRLYDHLGWRATDDRRPAPWPPYPVEMRYERVIV